MPSALLLQWLWTRHRRLLVSDLTAENAAVILRRQVIAVLVFAVATAWAAVTLLRH
jgi:hypothetical protein